MTPASGPGDPTLAAIAEAAGLSRRDPEVASVRLAQLWTDVGPDGDSLHRCALAHAIADVQGDLREELAWDLRALEAAEQVSDERLAAAGAVTSAAGLRPSLHLNLADVHRRLGEPARALAHVCAGRAALQALSGDGATAMLGQALARVERQAQSR